ncbi:Uncharacterized protein dnm_036780 [Desulfonema magnum]|uniref:Uncharacterized protein n=1 Tax=Desulfonema magnum TaxID=45655 RepID=A0A975GND1_9BACT|nr:Uncharacterized protein dnm_036780 [Desulfonema magnum]
MIQINLIITDLGEADKAPWGRHICSSGIHHVGLVKPRGGGIFVANLLLQICRPYRAWSALP